MSTRRKSPIILGPYTRQQHLTRRLSRGRRLIRALSLAIVILAGGLALFLATFHFLYEPRLRREVTTVPTAVHRQLAARHAPYTPISQISPAMQRAVVAIEDRRFYEEHGIDPLGLLRALIDDLRAGRPVEGGSTITEQLVKRTVFHADTTVPRKAAVLAWSWEMANRYSKARIMELYLNAAYYGRGAYGIGAAARRYFHRRPSHLSVAQAAFLAALLQSPSYDGSHPSAGATQLRWKTVLADMVRQGYISDRQATVAARHPVVLAS